MSRKKLLAVMSAVTLATSSMSIPAATASAATTLKLKNITNSSKTMYVGKSFTIKTNISTGNLSFKSSNTKVAKVSKKGVLTAKAAGTCTITVTAKLKKSTKKKSFQLKVKKKNSVVATTTPSTTATATPVSTQTATGTQNQTASTTDSTAVQASTVPAPTETTQVSATPKTTAAAQTPKVPAASVAPTTSPKATDTLETTASPEATTTPVVTAPPEVTGSIFVTSITFSDTAVTLADEAGNTVNAEDASNLYVTNGTSVTIVAPTNDTANSDNDKEIAISGTCNNGQIVIDVDKTKYKDGEVDLSLAGLSLSNAQTSPIYIASIDSCCNISIKKDTSNTLSDGESYTNADGDNGVIYSKDDLKIKGKGTLKITGNCGYGIVSKDDLKIFNGTIDITSKDACLKGKDSVKFGDKDDLGTEGSYDNLILTLESTASDCVRSNNPIDDASKVSEDDDYGDGKEGTIVINGGTFHVKSYADAFQSNGTLTVNGGTFDIYTYEGSDYSTKTHSDQPGGGMNNVPGNGGGWGNWSDFFNEMFGTTNTNSTSTSTSSTTSSDVSAKGFKSAGDMLIAGGNGTFDVSDDAFHCGGVLTINNGTYTIASGDDGVHSDTTLNITGGTITVNKSYEGIEGTTINISGGVVDVATSDDGINAAGGNSNSIWGGGSSMGNTTNSNYQINITGGTIHVDAHGDGIDSNGSLTISGGLTLVEGPENNGNSCLDTDGSFTFTGGIVLALDAGGMNGEGYPSNTTNYLTASLSGATSDKNIIAVTDNDGNVVSLFQYGSKASRVVYMNSDLTLYDDNKNANYKLVLNPTYTEELDALGYASTGKISDGTPLTLGSASNTTTPQRPGRH